MRGIQWRGFPRSAGWGRFRDALFQALMPGRSLEECVGGGQLEGEASSAGEPRRGGVPGWRAAKGWAGLEGRGGGWALLPALWSLLGSRSLLAGGS